MTNGPRAARPPTRRERTAGALAVAGVVVAFSLSSTLVKRAHAPGVLLAFWRMVTVSVLWNLVRWSRGRRITAAGARRVALPGVFLGLNLATFFLGATHNSVANAALIGSLSPFLIVPLAAWFFHERLEPVALLCALVAFGGVGIVLFSAPANGDASVRGNVFGMVAMVLWAAYFVATRRYRGDMDVTTFMATVAPVAAVAVLPLAIAHGDVFAMGRTGWTYMLVLSVLNGVVAHGLLVFAQKTVALGTIGIVQVIQPALAVVWSFALLGETVRAWQVVGIVIVHLGLLAFVLLERRSAQAPVATA